MPTSTPELVFGVDIGTTGCKTIATDCHGQIHGTGNCGYTVTSPRPGWVDQDPIEVLRGVIASVRECSERAQGSPRAVCFAGALHSVLPVDQHDQPLVPALTWADCRSSSIAGLLQQSPDSHTRYVRTGCRAHSIYLPSKILWLCEHEPAIFSAATRFVSIKEFVIHALTGAWLVDHSLASGSGLLNIHSLDWDDDILAQIGIERTRLSPLTSFKTDLGTLKPMAVREMGLRSDTRVIIGASDAALSNVGAGAIDPGIAVAMIGSSGAVRTFSDHPILDEHKRTWCYLLSESHYLVGGAINNAGIALRWIAENLFELKSVDAYKVLTTESSTVEPGSAGLIFLPFLTGERSPGWNARARGVLFGLSLHHSRRHVVRSVLESVCYRIRSVLEATEQVAGPITEVRASGGFLSSPLWSQMLADVLNRTITVPVAHDTSALGAAHIGWFALGACHSWDQLSEWTPLQQQVQPDKTRYAVYSRLYELYQKLYNKLQDEFAEISDFQESLTKDSL